MARVFAEIAFTPAVRAEQDRNGAAKVHARFLAEETERADSLTEVEAAFVAARDGFYQATVSQTGWPYVQFRGGPPGFLKVLDPKTLAYADFRGNRQYVSLGNLRGDGRVAMILMDYPNRRRLKILGRARTVDAADDPKLVAALQMPGYRARVERVVVVSLAGFDWNCPAHIPERFTLAELEPALTQMRAELAGLAAENRRLREELAEARTRAASAETALRET